MAAAALFTTTSCLFVVVLSEGIEHELVLKLLTFPCQKKKWKRIFEVIEQFIELEKRRRREVMKTLNGEEGKRRAGLLEERKSGDAAMGQQEECSFLALLTE